MSKTPRTDDAERMDRQVEGMTYTLQLAHILELENAALKAQVMAMRNCGNCGYSGYGKICELYQCKNESLWKERA